MGGRLLERQLFGSAVGRLGVENGRVQPSCYARRLLGPSSMGPPLGEPQLGGHQYPAQRHQRLPRGQDPLTSWLLTS